MTSIADYALPILTRGSPRLQSAAFARVPLLAARRRLASNWVVAQAGPAKARHNSPIPCATSCRLLASPRRERYKPIVRL